jgi:hypothetical protein
MKLPRRKFLHLAVGVAALSHVSRTALAQSYPTRPVRIVVPFPAGQAPSGLPLTAAKRYIAAELLGPGRACGGRRPLYG